MQEKTLLKPKIRLSVNSGNDSFFEVKKDLLENNLTTVCIEAHCPNKPECWANKTATFMLMGKVCTRGCRFCAVKTTLRGETLDYGEADRIIGAVKKWKLEYVVLTSVDRDDLEDYGSGFFAEAVRKIKSETNAKIECLIPDFLGNRKMLKKLTDEKPDVLGHNIETVSRLSFKVRDYRAGYEQSLKVLKMIKELDAGIKTKSSLMLGLGETKEEIIEALKDLRKNEVDFLVLGQYLKPENKSLEVEKYYSKEEFQELKEIAEGLGFSFVVSQPLARTSYHAWKQFQSGK